MSARPTAAPGTSLLKNEPKLPWDEVTFSKSVFVVCGEGEGLFEELRPGKHVLPKTE